MAEADKNAQEKKLSTFAWMTAPVVVGVFLPILILVLNIIGTTLLLQELDVTEGSMFLFMIGFVPLVSVAAPIFFCLIYISPLQLKMRRAINIAVSILVTIPMILLAVTALDSEQYVITELPLKNGYDCHIYADSSWEVSRLLYYEIRKSDEIIIPLTRYGSDRGREKYKFRAVYAENDTIIGIIETDRDSQELIAIYDAQTNESWPGLSESRLVKKWTYTFLKLKKENVDMPTPGYFENN